MEPLRPSATERRREEDNTANRRRTKSLRVGAAGIVLLFAAGISMVVSPGNAWWLLVLMGLGLVLILVAFLLIRNSTVDPLRMPLEK